MSVVYPVQSAIQPQTVQRAHGAGRPHQHQPSQQVMFSSGGGRRHAGDSPFIKSFNSFNNFIAAACLAMTVGIAIFCKRL